MSEPLEIHLADLNDPATAQAIVEILDSYAGGTGGGGRALNEDVRQRLPAALSAQAHARVWLACRAGRPVGTAVCFLGFSTFAAAPLLNLHDLAVLPDQRGNGVGSELLDAIEAAAASWNCCKITLEVRADNPRAEELYRRLGYRNPGANSEQTKTHFLEKRL